MSTMTDSQKVLRIVASLFDYPNEDWYAQFPQFREAIASVEDRTAAERLGAFLDAAQACDHRAFEKQYVNVFDFGKQTSLSLTSRSANDELQQRMSLLSYSIFFEENGFASVGEAADHFPAVLELASAVPGDQAARIMTAAKPDIKLLHKALSHSGSDQDAADDKAGAAADGAADAPAAPADGAAVVSGAALSAAPEVSTTGRASLKPYADLVALVLDTAADIAAYPTMEVTA